MTCDEARERMVFFVDGEDEAVGDHVELCAQCRAIRDAVAVERDQIGRALRGRPRARRAAPHRMAIWPFAAAAAAALFAVALVATRRTEPTPAVAAKAPVPVVVPEPIKTPELPVPPVVPKPEPKPVPPEPKPSEPRPEPPTPNEQPAPPEPPKPEPPPQKPTEPARLVEVVLTLEKGAVKSGKWEGSRVFVAGESFQAKSAMRVAWGGAVLHVRENSTLTVMDVSALSIDTGEVVVESAGAKLSIRAGGATFVNTGTRFHLATDGKQATLTVFEGRVSSGDREVLAGERLKAGKIDAAKDLYPAWMAKTHAPRVAVAQFDFKSTDKRWFGTARDGALHGVEKDGLFYTGVESAAAMFTVPARGEFWVTYVTQREDPITLRVRTLRPESTAFDYVVAKPVPGRAVAVRAGLEQFKSHDGKALGGSEKAHILYVFTKDAASKLRIDDLAIVEIRE